MEQSALNHFYSSGKKINYKLTSNSQKKLLGSYERLF